jgi:hypothetical protein
MADTFNIRVTKRVTIAPVGFSPQQMQLLGAATVEAMKARFAKGLDVQDQPAAALSRGYTRRKQRQGAAPLPDLRLTGQMLAALGVLRSAQGQCSIGFNDDQAIIKAYVNHQRRRQIGISDGDAIAVRPLALDILRSNVRAAVRSVIAA